jgi:hypothetical protein
MMFKKQITGLLILFSFHIAFPQLTIKGTATDSVSKKPVDYLLVAIFHYQTDKIITYAYTNEQGQYKIVLPYISGLFTLQARSLEYQEYKRDIVLTESGSKEIDLSLQVIPKINTLSEVVVKAKLSPVIIKKDTIIYDVAHYTQTGDQTLEDVLRKMPGFEVQENGELKINGKPIGKVLINGEEFLKGGAALNTRSIAPGMIKNIEVRLDEKDTKLKESLLSSDKLIVLDIKLKDDLDKMLFGKARLTTGYQKEARIGGYANLFSLGKKQKYHLLGEYDAFGHQTISIGQISNIGREAMQSIFNLPADFNRLTENQEFNKEVYGFKDYTISKLGIAGLTAKYNLSKNLEMFIGTYNSYTKDGLGSQTSQQFFETGTNYEFNDQKTNTDYASKNKIDLQYNTEKVKINYNFNAVLGNKTFTAFNQNTASSTQFNTDKKNTTYEYYQNALAEYLLSKKVAFHTKAFYGVSNKNVFFDLLHNQPTYIKYLFDDLGSPILRFNQDTKEVKREFAADLRMQLQNKLGSFQIGFQYLSEERDIAKQAYKNLNGEKMQISNSSFNGITPILTYTKSMPYFSHRFAVGKVSINNKIGLADMKYPISNYSYESINLIEYNGGVQVDFNTEDNFSLSYSQKISSYATLNIAQGYDFIDFQTFAKPQQSSPIPKTESMIQSSFDKVINPLNTAVEVFALYAKSKTYNSYGFDSSPFISLVYDQLAGEYLVSGLKIATVFNDFPINFKLEPSYLFNRNDNITGQGQLYSTSTERRMIQLRALTKFDDKNFNFELKTKFSDFQFSSDLSTANKQQILSVGLTYKQDLFEKKIFFQSTAQHINFWGGNSAINLNVSGRLQYSADPLMVFVEGDNLLDNQYFIKQNIFPSYFTNSQQNLFGRYVKVGIEYTFK